MKEALLSIIKDENRIITGQIDPQYLSDNLGRKKGTAEAVVFPVSTEEISGVMRYAWKNNLPVTPRGAGTNLVGSTVPSGHGIVLDVSLMNHVLELDEETFTATVEPGVVLEDFQTYVESKGLFYPPDPGEKKATIGGNISTNAGGMRAVKYGVTRDYVMRLELVLADGTVVMAGSKNRKDTSGLDLKEIVIGSEGTLAVITKCILKLIPKPEDSLSVLLSFDSLKAGIESVRQIIQANLNPTAMEFIERKVIQLEDKEEAARVWKIRGMLVKGVEAVSEQEPLDIVVLINRIDAFVNFVNAFEKECGMRMISFGHAGDGNVHLCVVRGDRDDETWEKELDANLTVLYDKAYALGGLASGEHGIGLSKQKYLLKASKPENIALMKRVKAAFDEKNILNAGISYNV